MFDRLLKSLLAPAPKPLAEPDAKRALTALLVRIAKSDGIFDAEEAAVIREVVTARYGLAPDETDALMAEAETLEAEAPDTVRFTEAIKNAVPYEDRASVVSAAWRVVLADGDRADEEDALMRLIARFLGITDRESHVLRQKAAP